ncbi:Zinc finger protein zfs1 [Leucoagaricus sp. SymC.cos]|nr:Zinc finger protein zfs1 [Leucoagaricus sp. SymC.cos]
MPARTDTIAAELPRGAGQRWRLSPNGHVVDVDHTATSWSLAEDLVRLQISDVSKDGDELHRTMHTPPKTKLSSSVSQLNENSPLDTSSNTSLGSSPHTPDHQLNIAHSRGSSTDSITSGSHDSSPGAQNTLLNHSLKGPTVEPKERPHSFSGGLSAADLRRLQQFDDASGDDLDPQNWGSSQYRDNLQNEQLQYPTLTQIHRPQPLSPPQLFDYRNAMQSATSDRDEPQIDYNLPQRYSTVPQGLPMAAAPPPPTFVAGRPLNSTLPSVGYRQPPRTFPQQTMLPNPNPLAYPVGHHTSHLSLGNTQQLYEMMIPPAPHDNHPAVARIQQQHNVFRGGHHHSASDPSAMRDAATLSLLNYNSGLYPPVQPSLSMFPQFYGPQDLVAAQLAAARQFATPYSIQQQQPTPNAEATATTPTASTNGQSGPSANNRKLGLYKTELCRSWEEKGSCRYGAKCQFAHGEEELRKVARHPKYKTEICRTFWVSGSCPYGKRCCFIHTELPTNGQSPATPGSENPPEARPRSMSNTSDPNDSSVSLLARISAKRTESNASNLATPVEINESAFPFGRPGADKLRINTTVPASKQNKSAYPTFASNGILLPAGDQTPQQMEPAPVTAGPDLGRQHNARLEIVGFNNQGTPKKTTAGSSIRHSFNGTEVDMNLASLPTGSSHTYTLSTGDASSPHGVANTAATTTPRVNGHVRTGSAGNWASFSRSQLANSSYPGSSSPAADRMTGSPWNDIAIGSARLHEKAWA